MMCLLLFSLFGEPSPPMVLKPVFELEFKARDANPKTMVNNEFGVALRYIKTNFSYDSARVGFFDYPSGNYWAFLLFADKASIARIVQLTEHKNPVAVAYAFKALKTRNRSLFNQLVGSFLKDQRPVKTQSGCIGTEQPLGEVLQNIIDEAPVVIQEEIEKDRDFILYIRKVQHKQP